jgi:hypothetical protein
MGAGYWLNPSTGMCVRVATTHDEWVRDKQNADHIGLPGECYHQIMRHPATAVDEIRLLALDWGLVRIREHPRYVSVQFKAQPHRVNRILGAVIAALEDAKVHPDTRLVIDNLLLHDSASLTLTSLQSALENDQPVLRQQRDAIDDISVDRPFVEDIRRRVTEDAEENGGKGEAGDSP